MDVFIVSFLRGNRRVRSTSIVAAWKKICPNEIDVQFKPLDQIDKKYEVVKGSKRIGHITRIPKNML